MLDIVLFLAGMWFCIKKKDSQQMQYFNALRLRTGYKAEPVPDAQLNVVNTQRFLKS